MVGHRREEVGRVWDIEVYELKVEQQTQRVEWDEMGKISAIVKHAESFAVLPIEKNNNDPNWSPVRDGWLSPTCHQQKQREKELSTQPEATVEKPPNEWRFCQDCGEKLDSARTNGQYCVECADRKISNNWYISFPYPGNRNSPGKNHISPHPHTGMAIKQPVERGIRKVAISRVLDHIHRKHRAGRRVFTLTELSNETAIDPTTMAGIMRELETVGPYDVNSLGGGEVRWRIDGCVFDIGEWNDQNWNLD